MWNRVSKKEGRNGETVEAEAMNGGGPARVSSCRFRRTRELLCARAEMNCLDAGTVSDEAVLLGDRALHGLSSKEQVPPRYPDKVL